MKVAVTGANGFVGRQLVKQLNNANIETTTLVRPSTVNTAGATVVDYNDTDALADHFAGAQAIIHLVGKAHHRGSQCTLADYNKVNVDIAITVANAALKARAKRFIYLSSIKVLGENTPPDQPFSYASPPRPEDAYGQSKLAAEQALQRTLEGTPVELIIVRPPLVWGENPKGNLASLLKWAERGLPLPFDRIQNRRHWVSVNRLCNFLRYLAAYPGSLANVPPLLIADPAPLSTSEAIKALAHYAGVPIRMFPIPMFIWRWLQRIPVLRGPARKLSGNLEVDIQQTHQLTGWQYSIKQDSPEEAIL